MTVIARIQASTGNVKNLLRQVVQTNDQLIIKCVREKLNRLQVVEAGALGAAAKVSATRPGQLRDAAVDALFGNAALAEEIESDARSCLRIQSGVVVTYGQDEVIPPPDVLPDVPLPGGNYVLDPGPLEYEPREAPVSNAQLP